MLFRSARCFHTFQDKRIERIVIAGGGIAPFTCVNQYAGRFDRAGASIQCLQRPRTDSVEFGGYGNFGHLFLSVTGLQDQPRQQNADQRENGNGGNSPRPITATGHGLRVHIDVCQLVLVHACTPSMAAASRSSQAKSDAGKSEQSISPST